MGDIDEKGTIPMGRSSWARLLSAIGTMALLASVVACGDDDDDAVADDPSGGTQNEESGGEASTENGDPYGVYAVIDQTGPLGPVYTPAAEGVRDYFDELNAAGGVNGRQVNLTLVDSQSTPERAQALYRQAIDDEPVAIFSMSASPGVSAAAPLLIQSGIPTLGVGMSDELLYPEPEPNMYMLQPTSEQQVVYGLGLVRQLVGTLDGTRIAMVGLSPSSIIDAAYEKITDALEEEGGEVARIERPTSPIADFTTQAVNVAQSEADAVFLSLAPSDAISVSTALNDAGLDVPIIVLPSSGTDAPEVFESIGADNYYAVRFVQLPRNTPFADTAGNEHLDSAAWATGWLFGELIATGLEECGVDCDSEQLNEVLQEAGPFVMDDIMFGPVNFTPESHGAVSAVQYFSWDPDTDEPVPAGDPIDVAGV